MSERPNNRFRGLATAAAFASLFSYAVVFTVTSASINEVGRYFHAGPATLGWLFRALMIGFFAGVVVAGRFSDRHGKLNSIWPGCVAMAVGTLIFAAAHDFRTALGATLIAGFGGGLSEGSAMALISDLYSGAWRMSMANWSQASFALGAIACPLAVGQLLKSHVDWHLGYYLAASLCALSGILTLSAFTAGREKLSVAHEAHVSLKRMLSDRMMLILAISIMLYVGAETGTGNWLAIYFRHDLGSDGPLAARSLSFFWLGITLGRMLVGWASKRLSEVPMTRACLAVGMLFQAVLLTVDHPLPGLLSVFLLGLCFGPVYPNITSSCGAAYPEQSGAALGIVVAAGSLGGAIFPPTIGVVAAHTGMRLALWTSFGVLALNLFMMMLITRREAARITG